MKMTNEQTKALIDLSDELKVKAHYPKHSSRYAHLLFVADAATLLSMGDQEGATKLMELVEIKNNTVIEAAVLKFFKILLMDV